MCCTLVQYHDQNIVFAAVYFVLVCVWVCVCARVRGQTYGCIFGLCILITCIDSWIYYLSEYRTGSSTRKSLVLSVSQAHLPSASPSIPLNPRKPLMCSVFLSFCHFKNLYCWSYINYVIIWLLFSVIPCRLHPGCRMCQYFTPFYC